MRTQPTTTAAARQQTRDRMHRDNARPSRIMQPFYAGAKARLDAADGGDARSS
jgi:hypothetical protein